MGGFLGEQNDEKDETTLQMEERGYS